MRGLMALRHGFVMQEGCTALSVACQGGHVALAGALLDADSEVEARDKVGARAGAGSAGAGASVTADVRMRQGARLYMGCKAQGGTRWKRLVHWKGRGQRIHVRLEACEHAWRGGERSELVVVPTLTPPCWLAGARRCAHMVCYLPASPGSSASSSVFASHLVCLPL